MKFDFKIHDSRIFRIDLGDGKYICNEIRSRECCLSIIPKFKLWTEIPPTESGVGTIYTWDIYMRLFYWAIDICSGQYYKVFKGRWEINPDSTITNSTVLS